MQLRHFSEDPDIRVFHPHVSATSTMRDEAFVWAIDDWHAPMYYVPRDCPRACFWPGDNTTPADRERWLNGLNPRFVMVVEAGWLDRIRSVRLYRYTMPGDSFSSMRHPGGHYVSRESVTPLGVEPVGDLLHAIASADVELRITPRLGPMWRRIWKESTLEFSGTRLRNAIGYPGDFGVADDIQLVGTTTGIT
jgi:hypothetical protein